MSLREATPKESFCTFFHSFIKIGYTVYYILLCLMLIGTISPINKDNKITLLVVCCLYFYIVHSR